MPAITVDQINKIIESRFKTQELDSPVIDHILRLVNRHVEACKRYDVRPVITRTVRGSRRLSSKRSDGHLGDRQSAGRSRIPGDEISSIPVPTRKPHAETGGNIVASI